MWERTEQNQTWDWQQTKTFISPADYSLPCAPELSCSSSCWTMIFSSLANEFCGKLFVDAPDLFSTWISRWREVASWLDFNTQLLCCFAFRQSLKILDNNAGSCKPLHNVIIDLAVKWCVFQNNYALDKFPQTETRLMRDWLQMVLQLDLKEFDQQNYYTPD